MYLESEKRETRVGTPAGDPGRGVDPNCPKSENWACTTSDQEVGSVEGAGVPVCSASARGKGREGEERLIGKARGPPCRGNIDGGGGRQEPGNRASHENDPPDGGRRAGGSQEPGNRGSHRWSSPEAILMGGDARAPEAMLGTAFPTGMIPPRRY